jgi:hypothetical protein
VADTNHLDCKIYVESDLDQDALAKLLAGSLSGTVAGTPVSRTVQTPLGDIDIRKNATSDKLRARQFPDGFLAFRYALELYPAPEAPREDRISLVARLLHRLWSQNLPAVAACDYEDQLPHRGGYNDRSVPWVSLELLPG